MPRDNAATFLAVPSALLDDEYRAHLMNRALADEDVYAYQGVDDKDGPVWNIWDSDTRIVLAPIATAWQVIDIHRMLDKPDEVQIFYRAPKDLLVNGSRMITVSIPARYSDDRVARRVASHMNHCSRFGGNPEELDGQFWE